MRRYHNRTSDGYAIVEDTIQGDYYRIDLSYPVADRLLCRHSTYSARSEARALGGALLGWTDEQPRQINEQYFARRAVA